jgi:hypothetical protein
VNRDVVEVPRLVREKSISAAEGHRRLKELRAVAETSAAANPMSASAGRMP